MRFPDLDEQNAIGFSFIMNELNIITPYGIEEKKNIKPYSIKEKKFLENEFNNIEIIIDQFKCDPKLFNEVYRYLERIKDIRKITKRCKNAEILDDVELYEIKYFAFLIEDLVQTLNELMLKISCIRLISLNDIITLLDPDGYRMSTFYIYESYSEKLKEIRCMKRNIENKIYLEQNNENIKKLKQERLNIVLAESEEELKIRENLSSKIRKNIGDIEKNIKALGKMDLLIAKAMLAIKYDGIRPQISEGYKLILEEMFNPQIKENLKKKNMKFVPITLELVKGVTVITGANMGGKSVSIKTTVLNVLLAQMGFFVFAEKACIPIFDFIGIICDDMQDINQGLSTFGAEIIKSKELIEYAKNQKGFIALDEFARGTNPEEGLNLVKAMCRYLNDINSISLISTHYDGVISNDICHYQVVGLKNVDFQSLKKSIDLMKVNSIEMIQQHMDYRLIKIENENEIPKDAFNICTLLGFEESIINMAKEMYKNNAVKGE